MEQRYNGDNLTITTINDLELLCLNIVAKNIVVLAKIPNNPPFALINNWYLKPKEHCDELSPGHKLQRRINRFCRF